jgi:exodeoxyribonuclease VII large subunit
MHIFSVRTLTQAIKDVLEGEFPFVWVWGQVLNLFKRLFKYISFSSANEVIG